MFDLVTAGDAFDDFVFYNLTELPRPGRELRTDAFVRTVGGGAVITAIAAARLGIRCAVASAVSAEALQRLRQSRVAVRNLRRSGEPAALTVALSTARDRRYITFNGANARIPPRVRRVLPRLRARHVHFAFCPRPCRPWISAIERLRRRGTSTSWDFGWNPALARDRDLERLCGAVDILFLNRSEARLYGRRGLWRSMPHPVVIKLGSAGARLIGRGLDLRSAAPRARVIDTTGAGDVFNAGFLVARLRGAPWVRALRFANRLAAKSTERAGGV